MYTIPNGAAALFRFAGKDSGSPQQYRAITGTVTTSNAAVAYIGKVSGDQFCLKSRPGAVAAGATVPVDVTVNAITLGGVALDPQVFNFQIQGPPLPPEATHVVMYEGPIGVDGSYTPPADPGSDTIPL